MESQKWDILLLQCVFKGGHESRGDYTWRCASLRRGFTRGQVSSQLLPVSRDDVVVVPSHTGLTIGTRRQQSSGRKPTFPPFSALFGMLTMPRIAWQGTESSTQ
jgi:hypothetical protein